MHDGNELGNFMRSEKRLTSNNRAVRLKLFHLNNQTDDILLPQLVTGTESVCGGFEYRISCVATSYSLPLKEFIGLPASLASLKPSLMLVTSPSIYLSSDWTAL